MKEKKKGCYFRGQVKKKPLLIDEQKILLEVAKKYKIYRNRDIYKTVLTLLDTGMHKSVMANPIKYELVVKQYNLPMKKGLYIEWYRPKKSKIKGFTSIKASKQINIWIVDFISKLKPIYKNFFNEMCIHLQKLIISEYPNIDFYGGNQLSPSTFRHTCCCNLLIKGMPEIMVGQVLNVDKKTLGFYANFVGGMINDVYNTIDW